MYTILGACEEIDFFEVSCADSKGRCLEDVARHLITHRGTRHTVVERTVATVVAAVAGSTMNATATTANTMVRAAHINRVHITRTSRTTDTRQSRCHRLSSSRRDHPSPPSLRRHLNNSNSPSVKRSSSSSNLHVNHNSSLHSSLRSKSRAPSRRQRRLTISSRKPRCSSRSPHPLSRRRKSRHQTSKR